ncbi:hypothetical protein ES705_26451 [subsurface metagenome]
MKLFIFLLYYIVRKKVFNPKKSLWVVIIYTSSIVNSYLIAFISKELELKIVSKLFLIIIISFCFASYYFPVYNEKKKLLPDYLPLSKKYISILEIGLDLLNMPLYFIVFNIGLYIFGIHSNVSFIGSSITIITIHYITRILQAGPFFVTSKKYIFYIIIGIFIILYIYLTDNNFILFNLISLLFFITAHLIIETNYIFSEKSISKTKSYYKTYIYLSFIFKSFFLILFILFYYKNINNPTYEFLGILSLTPTPLFTYVFNNAFGLFPKVFLNLIYFGNNHQILKKYTSYLLYPLLIDVSIFLVFLFITQKDSYILTFIYLTSIVILFPLGLFFSFLYPKKISTKFSFNSNNPVIPSLITVVVISIIALPYFNSMYFTLYFLFIPMLIYIIIYMKRNMNKLKNNVHPKL